MIFSWVNSSFRMYLFGGSLNSRWRLLAHMEVVPTFILDLQEPFVTRRLKEILMMAFPNWLILFLKTKRHGIPFFLCIHLVLFDIIPGGYSADRHNKVAIVLAATWWLLCKMDDMVYFPLLKKSLLIWTTLDLLACFCKSSSFNQHVQECNILLSI